MSDNETAHLARQLFREQPERVDLPDEPPVAAAGTDQEDDAALVRRLFPPNRPTEES